MNVATRSHNGVTILDVSGHIDIGNSSALRKMMLASVKTSDRLAVNLAAVQYIDSSGIASLLEVLKESRASSKDFVLFGLSDAVRDVLELTRLTRVFDVRETEQEALDGSAPARTQGSAVS